MDQLSPQAQLGQMLRGYWVSQAIYVAAKLQIADHLGAGPKHCDELARLTDANTTALYRLLRALAGLGIFTETAPHTFALTELAQCLRKDHPHSQWAAAVLTGDCQYRAWAELRHSVQTGQPGFDKVFGTPLFGYLSEHPAVGELFDATMASFHGQETKLLLEAYDFSAFGTLVDVGGGNGSLLAAVLERHPALHGILFDLPAVIQRAREAGLPDRCEAVAGDFFQSIDIVADAYLMRNVIHDWDDDKATTILRNCHRAMPEHGRLLIIEQVIPPGNEPFGGKLLDLVMLVVPGGQERTRDEYTQLLAESGFTVAQIIPTAGEVSVIEAKKGS